MPKFSDSLRGYGHEVYLRDGFTCKYCGFDGRSFPNWLQLTVDHVLPKNSGGSDDKSNKITACRACNSITSRMKFPKGTSTEEAKKHKISRVRERQAQFFNFWKDEVAPTYLTIWRKTKSV